MSKVIVDISVSVDGFAAASRVSAEEPATQLRVLERQR